MPKARYDCFVSYSSQDRERVQSLVGALSTYGLSVWYDQWEMRPGDRLRDRINEGIRMSRYFIILLSEHSVDAPWVRVELDVAMLRELDTKRVVVIPILIGNVTSAQIPGDMRGKHYLDLRDPARLDKELDRLVGLFDLEHRKAQENRRALLRSLRNGLPTASNPSIELRRIVKESHQDYAIQKAALAGLVKLGTPEGMLGLAERMLDLGGIDPLEYCNKLCVTAATRGGLFLLTATLFYDSRFMHQKLDCIVNILRREMPKAATAVERLGDTAELHREPPRVRRWSQSLSSSDHPDVAQGIVFGAQFDIGWGWQRTFMAKFSDARVNAAFEYADEKIPGIGRIFLEQGHRRGPTYGE